MSVMKDLLSCEGGRFRGDTICGNDCIFRSYHLGLLQALLGNGWND
jgi:hypothetical protein